MKNREFIEREFESFFEMITDSELRAKTIKCWELAMEEGKKTGEDLKNMPFTIQTDNRGITLLEHTRAVTAGAFALYEAIVQTYNELPFEVNRDWLIVGGLLHDVGKCIEIENDAGLWRRTYTGKCVRHTISGAILADRAGLPVEIVNMIACHSKDCDGLPRRIETVFIRQADLATYNPMVMMDKGLLIR